MGGGPVAPWGPGSSRDCLNNKNWLVLKFKYRIRQKYNDNINISVNTSFGFDLCWNHLLVRFPDPLSQWVGEHDQNYPNNKNWFLLCREVKKRCLIVVVVFSSSSAENFTTSILMLMVSKILQVVSFVIYYLFVLCLYTKCEIIFDIFEASKYLNILIFENFLVQL